MPKIDPTHDLRRQLEKLVEENDRLRRQVAALEGAPDRSHRGRAAPSAAGRAKLPPERYLDRSQYKSLIAGIREIVRKELPADARLLVVSRGDIALLDLEGRQVSHFPQDEQGTYAGYHPADSTAAITHLEALRAKGFEYLLVPATSFWWFGHYKHFRRHLERRYPVVLRRDDLCVLFSLKDRQSARLEPTNGDEPQGYRALVWQIRELVAALLPDDATVLMVSSGDEALLELESRRAWHFPQSEQGIYAGHYPADSAAAIEHLEELRAKGADYFVVPKTAVWWLTYYRDFAEHLATRYRLVTRQTHICEIYALAPPLRSPATRR